MANTENLKPNRSASEARERGRKGGINSGKSRRNKRDAKEAAKLFLDLAATNQVDAYLEKMGVEIKDRTNLMGIMARHTLSAQNGNVNSARFMLEAAGYLGKNTPDNNVNVNVNNDEERNVVIYIPDDGRDDAR